MKNKMKKAGLIFGGVITLIFVITIWGIDWHTDNKDVALRADFKAQDDVCKSYFKTMWSIIEDEANVVSKTSDDFLKIYQPLMEGRYGEKGQPLFEWIAESNPEYSLATHEKLMTTVNATRTQFHEEQKKKISIKAEHDKLRNQKPYKWFIDDASELELVVITDQYTEDTWATGHDEKNLEF